MTIIIYVVLLLACSVGIVAYFCDRSLVNALTVAFGRGMAQLALMGVVFWLLSKWGTMPILLLWTMLVCGVSAFLVVQRVELDKSKWLLPVGGGILISILLTGAIVLLALSGSNGFFSAWWMVPVVALLAGSTVASLIRGMSAYKGVMKSDGHLYSFLRGNGASRYQALMPFVRASMGTMLKTTVNKVSQMALYTVPLLLCGLLLGGMSPLSAILTMALMVAGGVAAALIALLLAIVLAGKAAIPDEANPQA